MSKEILGTFCSRCGKDISRDIIRCSNCGTPISSSAPRSGMLLASGVLSIIASGLFLLSGIISLFVFFQTLASQSFQPPQFRQPMSPQLEVLAILGGLSLVSFGLSLTCGVLTLDRKHIMWVYRSFVFAIIGPAVPFGVSFIISTPVTTEFVVNYNLLVPYFIFFSLPAICLDAVALIFVALRREDFPKS